MLFIQSVCNDNHQVNHQPISWSDIHTVSQQAIIPSANLSVSRPTSQRVIKTSQSQASSSLQAALAAADAVD
jgi:hypothetical protein